MPVVGSNSQHDFISQTRWACIFEFPENGERAKIFWEMLKHNLPEWLRHDMKHHFPYTQTRDDLEEEDNGIQFTSYNFAVKGHDHGYCSLDIVILEKLLDDFSLIEQYGPPVKITLYREGSIVAEASDNILWSNGINFYQNLLDWIKSHNILIDSKPIEQVIAPAPR